MKIGIISDIHGNIIALKACISYMKSVPCDEYLFLGDYISDMNRTLNGDTLAYLKSIYIKSEYRDCVLGYNI